MASKALNDNFDKDGDKRQPATPRRTARIGRNDTTLGQFNRDVSSGKDSPLNCNGQPEEASTSTTHTQDVSSTTRTQGRGDQVSVKKESSDEDDEK